MQMNGCGIGQLEATELDLVYFLAVLFLVYICADYHDVYHFLLAALEADGD